MSLVHLVEKNHPEAALIALKMLQTLVKNAKSDGAKYGSIKSSAKALQSRVLQCEGGTAALECVGFLLQDEAYVYDGAAPAEDVDSTLAQAEKARSALLLIGDNNTPEVATAALKLACIYAQNVVDNPEDAGKRRVNAANKAVQSRLLSARGGRELLAAAGFEAEGDELSANSVFACASDAGQLRVPLAVLNRASDVWEAEAARVMASGGGSDAQAADPDAPAEPVSGFRIRELPPASSLAGRRSGTLPNLQPALVLGEGGRSVELHCWLAPSKRWHCQGRMAIPSTTFQWAGLRLGGGACGLRIDVDLGDGEPPLPLEVIMETDEAMENEYHTSKRFIDANFEKLNNNYLEEVRLPLPHSSRLPLPLPPSSSTSSSAQVCRPMVPADCEENPHACYAGAADGPPPQGGHGGAELTTNYKAATCPFLCVGVLVLSYGTVCSLPK